MTSRWVRVREAGGGRDPTHRSAWHGGADSWRACGSEWRKSNKTIAGSGRPLAWRWSNAKRCTAAACKGRPQPRLRVPVCCERADSLLKKSPTHCKLTREPPSALSRPDDGDALMWQDGTRMWGASQVANRLSPTVVERRWPVALDCADCSRPGAERQHQAVLF